MEISRDEIKPPDGWIFKTDWTVDMNRAVDEEGKYLSNVYMCIQCHLSPPNPIHTYTYEGWEYAEEAGLYDYVPFERNTHLCRRRKWVRVRVRDRDTKAIEKKKVRGSNHTIHVYCVQHHR